MNRREFMSSLAVLPFAREPNPCFPGIEPMPDYPLYVPVSGSVGEGGAITLNSPIVPNGPGWAHFPAGIAFSCAIAGWYWTEWASSLSGTVYGTCFRGGAPVAGSKIMSPYATMGMGARSFTQGFIPDPVGSANGINLCIDGDSIMRGIAASTPAFSMQGIMLPQYKDGEVSLVQDLAVGGATWDGMFQRLPSLVSTFRPGKRNVAIAWCGTNDLRVALGTWQDILAREREYCAQMRAAGADVIVATMLPRSHLTPPNFEADRQSYNAAKRATWWQYADGFADVAADDRIGAFGAQLNTDYYLYDQTHPVDGGYQVIAPIFKAALDRLL